MSPTSPSSTAAGSGCSSGSSVRSATAERSTCAEHQHTSPACSRWRDSPTSASRSKRSAMPSADTTHTYPAESTSLLADVRRFVASASEPYLGEPSIHDLVLAVTEACANAIRHSGSDEIRVTIAVDEGCVEITIEDDGVYRMSLPVIDGDPGSHRGMYLMAAMVDDFSVHRGTAAHAGTTVRLLKCAS